MLLLRNKTYVSRINRHSIRLIYLGNNESELFIDDDYKGTCPFDYTKRKINKMEDNPMRLYNLKKADRILFKELREPQFDVKI